MRASIGVFLVIILIVVTIFIVLRTLVLIVIRSRVMEEVFSIAIAVVFK